jgi:hypothetical protein
VLCVRRVVFGVWPGPPSSHSFFPGRSPLEFRVLGVVGRLLVLWHVAVLVSLVWVCVCPGARVESSRPMYLFFSTLMK